MYRKIIKKLYAWKESSDRKPLVLMGARQVGKTWIMKDFGKQYFKNIAYVNCDEDVIAHDMFKDDYNIERILITIQAITGVNVEAGKTLIVIDEIQEAPRGLHSLKYFCENAPELHVVAAGSLLGISLGKKESFPVGKVDMIHLYPMDFDEFILAMGEDSLYKILHEQDWNMVQSLKTKYIQLLRQYYFVGGMPEVVAKYVSNKDLEEVRLKQKTIVEAYRNDISKHATKTEAIRITQVLDSLPSQLAKENKKFIYGAIKEGARASQFEIAIQWLIDAGIVHKVRRVSILRMPLKMYEDINAFKLFFLDCGLLGQMVNAPASQVLVGDNVFVEYKGAFTEQFVLQQLVSMNCEPYYWSNDKTPAEIDFVLQTDSRVIPIEVKAEENVRARSMSEYIKNNKDLQLKGLRVSMLGYVNQDWMENIPLYGIGKYHFV